MLNEDPFNKRDAQEMFGHALCTKAEVSMYSNNFNSDIYGVSGLLDGQTIFDENSRTMIMNPRTKDALDRKLLSQ